MRKIFKISIYFLLFILIIYYFFNVNLFLKFNEDIFSSQNNIESIYLSDKNENYISNFEKIKLEDKQLINFEIKFDYESFQNLKNKIFELDWDTNINNLYLNYNNCDYNICYSENYILSFLYKNNNINYYLVKENIYTNEIKKEDINKKEVYENFSLSFSNYDNVVEKIKIENYNWFKFYKNDFLLNYLITLKNFKSFFNIYNIIIIFIFILIFIYYSICENKIIEYLNKNIDKKFNKIYITLIFVFFIISWFRLYFSDLYILYDEYYSWVTIQQSFKDIIFSTAWDVHPPLYYFYLKLNSFIIDDNIISFKIANIFLIFPIFYFLYKFFKIIFKNNFKKYLLLITTFLIFNTYFLIFSSIIRMYFLWILIFLASSYFLIWYLESLAIKKENKIQFYLYFLFVLFWLYTHNYFLFFSFAQFIYILYFMIKSKLDKKYIFKLLFWYIIIWLLYLPWFFVLLKQSINVGNDYWISEIKISDVSQFLINIYFYIFNYIFEENFLLENYLFINIFIILIYLFLIFNYYLKNKKNILSHYFIFVIIIPLFCSIIYSIFKTTIFSERFFLFWIIFYVSLLIFLKNKKILLLLFILNIFIFVNNIWIHYLDNNKYTYNYEKNIVEIIEKQKPDIVINSLSNYLFYLNYYLDNNLNKINFINSTFEKTIEWSAYNWSSLFKNYKKINNDNISDINNNKILIIKVWAWEQINIPKKWELLYEDNNYIIYINQTNN